MALKIIPLGEEKDYQKGYYSNFDLGTPLARNTRPIPFQFYADLATTTVTAFSAIPVTIVDGVATDGTPVSLSTSLITYDAANKVYYCDGLTNYSSPLNSGAYYYFKITIGTVKYQSEYFKTFTYTAPFTCSSFTIGDMLLDVASPVSITITNNQAIEATATVYFKMYGADGYLIDETEVSYSIAAGGNQTLTGYLTPDTVETVTITATGNCSASGTKAVTQPILLDINITNFATQTTGVTLTFASGTVYGKYSDESSAFTFTSNVEDVRTYTTNETRKLYIYGSLSNITGFVADNSRISAITNLTTGLLTNLQLFSNQLTTLNLANAAVSGTVILSQNSSLTGITFKTSGNGTVSAFYAHTSNLTGVLDLSNVPISGTFEVYSNPNLTNITFKTTGNGTVTSFVGKLCNLTGVLNLSNVPISTSFDVSSNTNLTGITFKTTGNSIVTSFKAFSSGLTSLDLSNVPISGSFEVYSCSSLTGITFASSGNNTVSNFVINSNNLTGTLDLSNVPISGAFVASINPNLTAITFKSSGNGTVSGFFANSCNLSSLNLANVPISGTFEVYSNPSLTGITLKASGNGTVSAFRVYSCALPDLDITVLGTSNNINARHENNSMLQAEVDSQLSYYVTTGWTGGTLNLTGTNAAPSVTGEGYIDTLRSRSWTVTVTGGY